MRSVRKGVLCTDSWQSSMESIGRGTDLISSGDAGKSEKNHGSRQPLV